MELTILDDCNIKVAKVLSIEEGGYKKYYNNCMTVAAEFPELERDNGVSSITCTINNKEYTVTVTLDNKISTNIRNAILYHVSASDFYFIIVDTVKEYLYDNHLF